MSAKNGQEKDNAHKISYKARIEGLYLENAIEFNLDHEYFVKGKIEKIEKDQEYTYRITLYLKNEISFEQVKCKANKLIKCILNKIAYNCSWASVRYYFFESTTLPPKHGYSYLSGEIIIKQPKEEEHLRKLLATDIKSYGEQLYDMFREANSTDDIVSRYMFLYQILLELKGKTQRDVDKFICANSTCDPEYKVWQPNRQVKETKITFLRNSVAHVIDGVNKHDSIEDIKKMMRSSIVQLSELVKKAIGENLASN